MSVIHSFRRCNYNNFYYHHQRPSSLSSSSSSQLMVVVSSTIRRAAITSISNTTTASITTATINNNNNNNYHKQQEQQQQQYRTYTCSSYNWNSNTSSTTTNNNDNNKITTSSDSSSSSSSYTGSVKFYLRDKGYGFIEIDPPMMGTGGSRKNYYQPTDLFVHRNAIITTIPIAPIPLSNNSNNNNNDNNTNNDNNNNEDTTTTSTTNSETTTIDTTSDEKKSISIRYPYLKKGERVRFRIYTERNGLRRASDVTFLNGLAIPPLRKNYLGGIYERAHHILGEQIYTILNEYYNNNNNNNRKGTDEDNNNKVQQQQQEQQQQLLSINDTEILLQIQEAYDDAESKIQNAIGIVTSLGMKVTDFPITREKVGRGRYLYDNNQKSSSDDE